MTQIPPPGRHGGDAALLAAALGISVDDVLDLSASLNPLAPDPAPVLARHLGAVHRYPDPRTATAALAACIGVDVDRLLLTNGGSEAISLLSAEIGGRVEEPEFALHPRNVTGPRWRSNPHNPTGRLADVADTADVWDEAFYPLATGQWTRGDVDVPVVGSLTKLLACPGLRVGYVLAGPELVRRCRTRQSTWSVNGLACESLPELLAPVDLRVWAEGVAALRRDLISVLAQHGLDAQPSDANWILAEAPGLRERLAPHGVVVRDCSNFGLPGVVRLGRAVRRGHDRRRFQS